jgi:hypothetical protein
MKTFDFYRDEKNTIWLRLKFSIEAESYVQALEKIKQIEKDPRQSYENEIGHEYLYETLEGMDPEDNDGQSTCEIYSEDNDDLVYTNKPKTN